MFTNPIIGALTATALDRISNMKSLDSYYDVVMQFPDWTESKSFAYNVIGAYIGKFGINKMLAYTPPFFGRLIESIPLFGAQYAY